MAGESPGGSNQDRTWEGHRGGSPATAATGQAKQGTGRYTQNKKCDTYRNTRTGPLAKKQQIGGSSNNRNFESDRSPTVGEGTAGWRDRDMHRARPLRRRWVYNETRHFMGYTERGAEGRRDIGMDTGTGDAGTLGQSQHGTAKNTT